MPCIPDEKRFNSRFTGFSGLIMGLKYNEFKKGEHNE